MTFLNAIMLLGLAAVAIPIIIHILNRRKARVVEWGAMQFLEASLASRNRRILFEELVLMALRCLLLAALAFALARPFLKGRILVADTGDAQDVALVLDGSMSMRLDFSGKSNFQRAIDEAHQLVEVCRPNDAICLVLAGPTAQAPIPSPVSDHRTVHEALNELKPPGGSLAVVEALYQATLALAGGNNPAKKIILLSDGQGVGWDLSAAGRWSFLANAMAALPSQPIVIVRRLELPRQWRNACLSAATSSAPIGRSESPPPFPTPARGPSPPRASNSASMARPSSAVPSATSLRGPPVPSSLSISSRSTARTW
jgi:hypothetical protein